MLTHEEDTFFLATVFVLASAQAQNSRPSLLILDFEIEDDNLAQGAPVDVSENERRLRLAHSVMLEAFQQDGTYQIIDKSAIDATIHALRQSQALHTCNGCELDLARQAGADYVLVGWVQKVSNLILNVNAGVREVQNGREILARSVDMRGNTDPSWQRAVTRLARDVIARLKEKTSTR